MFRNDRRIRRRTQHQGHRRGRLRRQRGRAHDRAGRAGRGVHLRQHRRAGAEAHRRAHAPDPARHAPGLGAGAKPEAGTAAARKRDRIAESIDGADMLFITAGMGGGTGTGAAPVIADIAKELGILTVAVVTKPFAFEGKRAHEGGRRRHRRAGSNVDSLIVILNDKLIEVLGEDVTLDDAFAPPTTCCKTPSPASPRSSTARAWSTSTSPTCAP